jgi:hypothetical protein
MIVDSMRFAHKELINIRHRVTKCKLINPCCETIVAAVTKVQIAMFTFNVGRSQAREERLSALQEI